MAKSEKDLRGGSDYKLKETEEKLARQTKALKYAITAATAKIRIANAVRLRHQRKEAASGKNVTAGATAAPAASGAAVKTADVDVKVEETGKGGCCIIL